MNNKKLKYELINHLRYYYADENESNISKRDVKPILVAEKVTDKLIKKVDKEIKKNHFHDF